MGACLPSARSFLRSLFPSAGYAQTYIEIKEKRAAAAPAVLPFSKMAVAHGEATFFAVSPIPQMWNLLGYVEKNKRIPYDSSRGKYLLFISHVRTNSDTFEISNRMYSFFFADGNLKPLWRAVS